MTYTNILELDRDCIIVNHVDRDMHLTPERFWKREIIRKKDLGQVKEFFIESNYKPSTIPYYTHDQLIKAINENIDRGHYILTENSENIVYGLTIKN